MNNQNKITAVMVVFIAIILAAVGSVHAANKPPRNPFLADSIWPMAHTDSAQSDSVSVPAPTGPTRQLDNSEIDFHNLGFFQLGAYVTGAYENGKRVIWSNGTDRIVKLDYETFEILDTYMVPGKQVIEKTFAEKMIKGFNEKTGISLVWHSLKVRALVKDISSIYGMVDRDNRFYLGGRRSVSVYEDEQPGKADSKIKVGKTYNLPEEIPGTMVGMNMTYDGYVVLATTMGYVIVMSRDFTDVNVIKMTYSDQADPDVSPTLAWVRNSFCLDEDGGIYIVSNDHMHRVAWTGSKLSVDEADGAWSVPYRNGLGKGSGATPSLMGYGDEDRFVVITDGDKLMNMTLFWRDAVPADWKQLDGAPSRRIAGYAPVNFGTPDREEAQSEQSVVTAGYGAVVVNNEPSDMPFYILDKIKLLFIGFMSGTPEYQPYGVQKFAWDPAAKTLKSTWVNRDVSSPNSVPFVSTGSGLFYTVGVRNKVWTVEGIDWNTGESAFHYKTGDERFNSSYAALSTDGGGRLIYPTAWGIVRLNPKK